MQWNAFSSSFLYAFYFASVCSNGAILRSCTSRASTPRMNRLLVMQGSYINVLLQVHRTPSSMEKWWWLDFLTSGSFADSIVLPISISCTYLSNNSDCIEFGGGVFRYFDACSFEKFDAFFFWNLWEILERMAHSIISRYSISFFTMMIMVTRERIYVQTLDFLAMNLFKRIEDQHHCT